MTLTERSCKEPLSKVVEPRLLSSAQAIPPSEGRGNEMMKLFFGLKLNEQDASS